MAAGLGHKFHNSIQIHKLAIRFPIWIILDIYQVQYMSDFLKEKMYSQLML